MGVSNKALGSTWWKTGMPKTYKWTDRHLFSDRLLMEVAYSHVGNNFVLAFHEDLLRDVQPAFDIASGAYARSYQEAIYVRPTDSLDWTGNYFRPGWLGGDHAFKWGFRYRSDVAHSEGHWGGNTVARFNNFTAMAPAEANLYRDSLTEYQLYNTSFYVQDSFSRKRVVFNLGIRWDYQTDEAHAATVASHPFFGQATFAGVYNNTTYTGRAFDQLPSFTFDGAKALGDRGMSLQAWSPVVAATYDLAGDGKNVVKASYRRYISQIGTGALSSTYNTVGAVMLRYPWVDVNTDQKVQANEIVYTAAPLSFTGNYDYRNPAEASSPGVNDPNAEPGKTDEVLVSFDRQIGKDFAVSAAYMWRKYSNYFWSDTKFADGSDFGSQHYVAVAGFQPTGCPTDQNRTEPARCEPITYYQPTVQIPSQYVYGNRPDYWQGYQGYEISVRKRMSNHWMLNGGFSFNDSPLHYDSPAAYEDPTQISQLNGGQFAPQSTTSGLDNAYVNQRWIFRLSGAYELPWYQVNLASFYNAHDGNLFVQNIQGPTRPFSAGRPTVYLAKFGDKRLPDFQTIDMKVSKRFRLADRLNVEASMDMFNVFNWNTALAIRATQNAGNANQIQTILSPRVLRFGVRANW
jgi:hypothetical protein